MQLLNFFWAINNAKLFLLCFQGFLALHQIALFHFQHSIHGIIHASSHPLLGVFHQLVFYAIELLVNADKILRLLVIYLFQCRLNSVFYFVIRIFQCFQTLDNDIIKMGDGDSEKLISKNASFL